MTDYCECGLVANCLCAVCGSAPTCRPEMYTFRATLSSKHRFKTDLDLGHGVAGVAEGEAKDDVPVCLRCIPEVALQDLEQSLRPALSIEGLTEFERLCAVYSFNFYDRMQPFNYSVSPRQRDTMCLKWSVYFTPSHNMSLTFAEFAREFSKSAQRQGIKTQRERVSRFLRREGWIISRTSGKYGNSFEPYYFIAADGPAMWSYLAGWSQVDLSLPVDYRRDDERLACAGAFLSVDVFAGDRHFTQDK